MHVAGGADRNAQFVAQRYDLSVVFLQLFDVGSCAVSNHKGVVPCRLDFQVIIKLCQLDNFFMRSLVYKRLEEFTSLAGAAENQAFTVLHQN